MGGFLFAAKTSMTAGPCTKCACCPATAYLKMVKNGKFDMF